MPFNFALGITLVVVSGINYLLLYRFMSDSGGGHVRKVSKFVVSIGIQTLAVFLVSNIAIFIITMLVPGLDMEYIYIFSQAMGAGTSFILGYFLTVYFTFAERRNRDDTNT